MYTPTGNELGLQAIAVSSATQQHPLGKIITAYDPAYGAGEFIYLVGVANTAVGSTVTWKGVSGGAPLYQTALAPSTANLAQPVAVAMSANGAGNYGWYQIGGTAVATFSGSLTGAPTPVYLGTAGNLTSVAAAGKEILNALAVSAAGTPSAGFFLCEVNRPFAQGQIT